MMNRRLRKSVVVAAAVITGLLMTACDDEAPVDVGASVEESSDAKDVEGVSGSFKGGEVSYLAPGKYIVSTPGKGDQQFFLAKDTEIWGYGDICGTTDTSEGGEGGIECTEAELETAAKKGFDAEVVVSNGIATTIRDNH